MQNNGFGNQARDNLIVRRLEKEIKDRELGDKKLEKAIEKYAVIERVDKIEPHYNTNKEIDSIKIFQKNKDERGILVPVIFDIPVPNKYITDIERLKDGDQLKFYIRTFDNKEGKGTIKEFIYKPDHSTKELFEMIEAEIKRSKAADDKHDEEIVNLKKKDVELNTKIEKEALDRKQADDKLQRNIDDETSSRKGEDIAIREDLQKEVERAKKAENELENAIIKEEARAKAAEEQLDKDIDQEARLRADADEQLDLKIEAETARAKYIESGLQKQIDDIELRRDVVDVVTYYDLELVPVEERKPTDTDLVSYNTSKLTAEDLIKVLIDNGSRGKGGVSYYRFVPGAVGVENYFLLVSASEPEATKKALNEEIARAKAAEADLNDKKADKPKELPPELKVPGVDYPWFMVDLRPVDIDESGILTYKHSGYNFNINKYYTWENQKLPLAATTEKAGFMVAKDKQLSDDVRNILTLKDVVVPPGHEKCNLNIPYRFDFKITESGVNVTDYTVALAEAGKGIRYGSYTVTLPYASKSNPGFMTAEHVIDLNKKAYLPKELPPDLRAEGVDHPYFMVNLKPLGIDAEGNFLFEHSGYNFNKDNGTYYTWKDQKILMAATETTGGFMTSADKVKLNSINELTPEELAEVLGELE